MTDTRALAWRIGVFVVKLGVAAALLYLVLRHADLGEIAQSVARADPGLVLAAFLLYPVGYALSITRWRLLLEAEGVGGSWPFMARAYLSAIFVSNMLPSTIGGDALRIYDSWRLGAGRAQAAAIILIDRVLGLVSLLLVGAVGLLFSSTLRSGLPLMELWIVALVGGIVVISWALTSSNFRLPARLSKASVPILRTLFEGLRSLRATLIGFRSRRRTLTRCFLLSIGIQLTVVAHFVLLAWALDVAIPKLAFVAIVPLSTLVMLLPITVNGIGIRENAYAFFFGLLGVSAATALAFVWTAYGLQLLQAAGGGLVYLLRDDLPDVRANDHCAPGRGDIWESRKSEADV